LRMQLILPEVTPRHFKEYLRLETNCGASYSPGHLFNNRGRTLSSIMTL
jgi:hypothetical protein